MHIDVSNHKCKDELNCSWTIFQRSLKKYTPFNVSLTEVEPKHHALGFRGGLTVEQGFTRNQKPEGSLLVKFFDNGECLLQNKSLPYSLLKASLAGAIYFMYESFQKNTHSWLEVATKSQKEFMSIVSCGFFPREMTDGRGRLDITVLNEWDDAQRKVFGSAFNPDPTAIWERADRAVIHGEFSEDDNSEKRAVWVLGFRACARATERLGLRF